MEEAFFVTHLLNYLHRKEMYVECSSMFTEKSLPGTNVAAKTQLVRNDSHQNWRSSKLFQLIEVSVCVFFFVFF